MNKAEISTIVQRQRDYFLSGATLSVDLRRMLLEQLEIKIYEYAPKIQEALYIDLGKNPTEAWMSEIGMVLSELRDQLRHLDERTKIKRVHTPLAQFYAQSEIVPMPYGNVLVMSPWNYPFLLSMDPVIEAVAAGNTVVLKPGRAAAATSQVLADLIQDVFVPEYVTVVQGGREENTSLLDEKFDYIFFTGSPSVGKTVMSKAAVHLTPVTLELGGKSPVIVDETANLALSARRIIWGKLLNAGQTCVAPDYIVVHRSVKDALVHQLQKEAKRQANPDSRIIDQKHMDGLVQMLEAQKALGKDVWGGSVDGLHMDLALVQADWDDPVMTQEIFGPILPILEYEDFYGLMDLLKQKDKPLAFYFFSRNKARMEFVKSDMDFGGGCINDVVIQLASDVLPFGGVGASGMGQYHGQYGFDTFSRPKSVVRKGLLIDLPVRYRPFTKVKKGLLKFFLG